MCLPPIISSSTTPTYINMIVQGRVMSGYLIHGTLNKILPIYTSYQLMFHESSLKPVSMTLQQTKKKKNTIQTCKITKTNEGINYCSYIHISPLNLQFSLSSMEFLGGGLCNYVQIVKPIIGMINKAGV